MAGTGGETTNPYAGGGGINETNFSARRRVTSGVQKVQSKESINLTQKVGTTETELYASSATATAAKMISPQIAEISNVDGGASAVTVKLNHWSADKTKESNPIYMQFLLSAGQSVSLPMSRVVAADNVATVLDGTALAQAAPDSNMHLAVTNGSDAQLLNGGVNNSASTTTVAVDDGDYFKAGDLIKVGTEIMEVTSVSSDNLTVIRAVHGSTIDTHADDAAILFPFFNAYHEFTAATGGYDLVQTDNDGKFKAMNFFGYGRGVDYTETGILPGSVSIKFYNPGYQELGLSGITPGTNSGLTAGTTYQFTIAVDGGSAYDADLTIDSSNTNFGGRNGVLNKIQDIFDTAYYTSGNLFEKKVTVGIVNGDIRFTSGSCLSTSAIALGDSSGGDTDLWGVGRIPAFAKVQTAVAARLPDDTIKTTSTGQSNTNIDSFLYDDGEGNLVGKLGRGIIDYETGAIDFVAKPNAQFVVGARYASALTGSVSTSSFNTIESIAARSVNDQVESYININLLGFPPKTRTP